jgi:hypothetical protein
MTSIPAAAFAAITWCALQPAHAAAFANGNFEAPGVADGTQAPIYAGSEPSGWQAGGTASPADFNVFYENDAWGVDGVDGPDVVGFGGDSTTGASLSQTFDTTAGTSYAVTWYVTAQQGSGDQSLLASVSSGGVTLASSAVAIPGYDMSVENAHWTQESFSFVATGPSSTLTFLDTSDAEASAGVNWALDAVDVVAVGASAVPESSRLATLLAGLGIVAVARRRQRRNAHGR